MCVCVCVCTSRRSLFVFSEYLVMVIEFQIIAKSYIRMGETPEYVSLYFSLFFMPSFSIFPCQKFFFSLPFVVLVAEDESVFFSSSFPSILFFFLVCVYVLASCC